MCDVGLKSLIETRRDRTTIAGFEEHLEAFLIECQ